MPSIQPPKPGSRLKGANYDQFSLVSYPIFLGRGCGAHRATESDHGDDSAPSPFRENAHLPLRVRRLRREYAAYAGVPGCERNVGLPDKYHPGAPPETTSRVTPFHSRYPQLLGLVPCLQGDRFGHRALA